MLGSKTQAEPEAAHLDPHKAPSAQHLIGDPVMRTSCSVSFYSEEGGSDQLSQSTLHGGVHEPVIIWLTAHLPAKIRRELQ